MKKDGLERVADGLPQTIEEAAMSDVAFMAQEAKNFKDFVNKFFKEFKQMSKNRESLKWLEDTYKSINESINEDENPCWKGYEMVGMKMKDGKEVPNCVPKNEVVTEAPIKIKRTITKKEWNKKHKDFKLMGKDGIPYIMVYDDKIGTHLVPVKIIDEAVDKGDLKNAKFRLKKVLKYLDIEYKETRGGKKYVQINYIPVTTPQYFGPEFVNVRYEDEKDLQNIGKALKLKLKESVSEVAKRDYKAEYKKFQSSDKSKKYRAELNKYNRQKGTYGNGDGKDASHKGGKIVGFETESKNRGRREKSRLKKK